MPRTSFYFLFFFKKRNNFRFSTKDKFSVQNPHRTNYSSLWNLVTKKKEMVKKKKDEKHTK